jgi:hypothetical protein
LSRQLPCGSAAPLSTGQQSPARPTRLQLTHGPWQATLQQTPSVQNPDAQSPSLLQTAPEGFGPQLPLTQTTPGAQSPFDLQVTTQASVAVSQSKGAQIVAGPALQWPVPSQTSTSTTAPFEHVPGLHTVPAA